LVTRVTEQGIDWLPNNVRNINILTFIASIFLLIYSVLLIELSASVLFNLLMSISLLTVAISGLTLSVYVTLGHRSRRLWGALMLHWSLFLVLWFSLEFSRPNIWDNLTSHYSFYVPLYIVAPLAYTVCCMTYFLTATPRKYFHITPQSDDGSRN
jgi:hypothetical protein